MVPVVGTIIVNKADRGREIQCTVQTVVTAGNYMSDFTLDFTHFCLGRT